MLGFPLSKLQKRPSWPWLALSLCLWAAPLLAQEAADDEPRPEQYHRFEAIAGAPQDSVRFFRVHYWQPIDELALVLWLGREEPYLVNLRERCNGLLKQLTLRIADYQRPGRNSLRATWSQIITDSGHSCRIDSIRALDFDRIEDIDPRYIPRSPASAQRKPLDEIATWSSPPSDPAAPPEDGRRWMNLLSIKMPQPSYPKSAYRRGRSGIVHVAAEVAPDGTVVSAELLISSGTEALDKAAVRTVKRWRFETYRTESPREHVWVQVPIVFSLP